MIARAASLLIALCLFVPGCGDTPTVSQPCLSDRDCDVGACVLDRAQVPVDLDPLALVCGSVADAATDSACCQSESDCARGLCLVSGACAVPCLDAIDCDVTERCVLVHARNGTNALQPLHACAPRVQLPDDVRVTENTFADVLTTDPDGVLLDLPAIAGTGIYVFEHPSESLWPLTVECRTPLCVQQLSTRDPNAIELFDATQLQPGNIAPLNTVNTSIDNLVSTILLPNGPRSVLSDVGYRVRLRSESAGALDVTRIERTQRGTRLNLHLHYVGAAGQRPEGARGPAFVADALEHAELILGQAGLAIGNVCQTEVVGALRERLSVLDPPRFGLLVELPQLFELSAGARGYAVHVFLVDQADVTLGISGGLPGPPGMHGTGSSGVVMSVALFDQSAQFGRALAHELGHYLGLFHPREADNVTLDPLGDTPNEPTNLMFRTATGGQNLTDHQRDVILASPLLD